MPIFDIIAFDADDTLWHSERLYVEAQTQFTQLLTHYHDPDWINDRLYQTEMQNIQQFGYGVKAFTLSMIETAIELTEGRITGADIRTIMNLGKKMLSAEVELLDSVRDSLAKLATHYPLMVITKGDLLDQERKMARSGLEEYFRHVEIVSQKSPERYARLLRQHSIEPVRFLMVGNSLKSDILPVLTVGGSAAHIPYEITWLHEVAEPPADGQTGYYPLESMGQLPDLLAKLERGA